MFLEAIRMISGVGSVTILSNEPHKLAEWYRNKFGFEIAGNEGHSVFPRAKGSDFLIHLCGKCDAWETDKPGGRTGILLNSGKVIMNRDKKIRPITPRERPLTS